MHGFVRHQTSEGNTLAEVVEDTTGQPISAAYVSAEMAGSNPNSIEPTGTQGSLAAARAVAFRAIQVYWGRLKAARNDGNGRPQLPPLPPEVIFAELPTQAQELAVAAGEQAADLDVPSASYGLGTIYTGMMPEQHRAALGAYYTPPALAEHLLDMATEAGANWTTGQVLDPACGGGAFLAPVAQRMLENLDSCDAETALEKLESCLHGFELDPFAAWMSQVFLEATLIDVSVEAGRPLRQVVQVGNALEIEPGGKQFDLVVGNPPYGRTKLPSHLRQKFDRSLFGHANLYGLFTDLGLRLAKPGGMVAYVTPTSFLAGAYFKTLRGLLGREAPPVSIDFITARKGVFADVLQETALTVYQRGTEARSREVRFTSVHPNGSVETTNAGTFQLPENAEEPWLIPRSPDQSTLVNHLKDLPHRLADYGYGVKTGPLVWNRHKHDLQSSPGEGHHPLIWAEAVRPNGVFDFRAEKKHHEPYFRPNPGQQWLVTKVPCILLQRTTAKEQHRRLIAAELPADFVALYDGVVVENHLNIIKAKNDAPSVSLAVLTALLNSDVVDQVFRCINGSVAVSAYELEALPLPSPRATARLEKLVNGQAGRVDIEREVVRLYGGPGL